MALPFAFIPRKIAKTGKARPPVSDATPSFVQGSSSPTVPGHTVHKPSGKSLSVTPAKDSVKGKSGAVDTSTKSLPSEDFAMLVCLALSDHSLWSDPDLRCTIEQDTERFIPLSFLLRHSSVLRLAGWGQDVRAEEMCIVKALRTYANDVLEVRMLVSEPSGGWHSKDRGIYELRRKDWECMLQEPSREYARDQWEKRTVYLENIPVQYRTSPGIAWLTSSLLSRPGQSLSLTRVQNISLPPHHQDQPVDRPKCKGFALVTLADQQDVETLLEEWPWNKQPNHYDKPSFTDNDCAHEAAKFGLRTLSKSRWGQLKDEYLTYQRELLDELVAYNEGPWDPPQGPGVYVQEHVEGREITSQPGPGPASSTTMTLTSSYPMNCLVFVRNIHPETNKTTLRKLFSGAFDAITTEGLDYVDFNKGMDSCYLRLASPRHSQLLVDHFTSHPTTQEQGLDDTGTANKSNNSAITVEIVQGKREELYWDKVPEKVRKQAVQKAVSAQLQSNTNIEAHNDVDSSRSVKRKNRK